MAHQFEKKWRSQDVQLQENVDFSAMLLNDRVLSGLTKAGFKRPSPIQLEAIPVGCFGRDLLVQAKSGTGKTLVFVTAALEMLKLKLHRPQVLILAPTREIATQICSVVKSVGSSFPKLSCNSFIGGFSVADDKQKSLTTQIVVGTPGRIKQLIALKALPTQFIRLLVFDEADKLLEFSFKEEIEEIFKSLSTDIQVIATSATYPIRLAKIMMHFLKKPYVACLNSKELALIGITHYAKLVKYSPMPLISYKNKLNALEGILKTIKFAQCLLFCNGVQKVEVLYRDVKKWGFSATYISSAKEQQDRLKAIERLKNFKCKVLVSSDLTARGIDAENVDLVINFDLSYGTETYLHRIGRAGRFGSAGVAITFVDENEIRYLKLKEEEGSFKVYKLPDPLPRNLIQAPILKEYFIENSESDNACSMKTNISDDANGSKTGKKKDKVKHTSNKTPNKSNHVSSEQPSTEKIPVSEYNSNLPEDVGENSSLISDTEPKRNIKNISPEAEDYETVPVSDEAADAERFDASPDRNDFSKEAVHSIENEETCENKPLDHPDIIKKAEAEIVRSELIENIEQDAGKEEVVVEDIGKSTDLLTNAVDECNFEINKDLRTYTDAYEANRDDEFAASNVLQDQSNLTESDEANGNKKFTMSGDEYTRRVTVEMYKRLDLEKRYYYYHVFKKYLDSNQDIYNEQKRIRSALLRGEAVHQSDSTSEIVDKEQNAVEHEDFIEKPCVESVPKFTEKPNHESTPQSVGEQKCDEELIGCSSRFNKPGPGEVTMESMFRELNGPPQISDDSELSDSDDEMVQNSSSEDSDSDSSSEDSSDFTSSSSSSSSNSGDFESDSSSSSSSCSGSSCSCESLTSSGTAKRVRSRKQKMKQFTTPMLPERPVRSNWQCPQRPPQNFGSYHCHLAGTQGCCTHNNNAKCHQNHSTFANAHVCSGSCFLPSQHRYHIQQPCHYGQACLQWYQMFYSRCTCNMLPCFNREIWRY